MSCDPERITGFVDGELDAESAAAVAVHLEACASCRGAGRGGARPAGPPAGPPGPRPAARPGGPRACGARGGGPSPRVLSARFLLPLAAVLVAGLWVRGHVPFVAWDLARDHDKCFSRRPLPAKIWSGEPRVVAEWFEAQGTRVPGLPDRVGELALSAPGTARSWASRWRRTSTTSRRPATCRCSSCRRACASPTASPGRPAETPCACSGVESEVVGIVGEREGAVQAVESALRPVLAAWLASRRCALDL